MGQHRHSHPVKSAAPAHTEHTRQLEQLRGRGEGGWKEGVMEDGGGYSWWRQVKHVFFGRQGFVRLQRPDLSGSSRCLIQRQTAATSCLRNDYLRVPAWLFDSQHYPVFTAYYLVHFSLFLS